MKNNSILQIDAHDNLVVALTTLPEGTQLQIGAQSVVLTQEIPAKHKFALEDLEKGAPATMYGVIVGQASRRIRAGELISKANLDHATNELSEADEPFRWQAPQPYQGSAVEFMGLRRPDGKVGTANYWIFVPMVFCSN